VARLFTFTASIPLLPSVVLTAAVAAVAPLRQGIDDIIRTISTYFVVFSETPNAKYVQNHGEIHL
jgi:hypothetical protein